MLLALFALIISWMLEPIRIKIRRNITTNMSEDIMMRMNIVMMMVMVMVWMMMMMMMMMMMVS